MFSFIQRRVFTASVKSYSSEALLTPMRQMGYLNKWHRKTSVFDKYQYNPNHIEASEVYKIKPRKPTQEGMLVEDPNYEYAVRPPTQHVGKTLILQLEKEEKERMIERKTLKIPDFRAGDVIEFAYYLSLSEKKFNMFKGLVTGTYNKKGLMKAFDIVFYTAGLNHRQKILVHSPMLAKIEVVRYGSNHIRNKLNHVWTDQWNKNKLEQPVTKGKGFKPRGKKAKVMRRNVLSTLDDSIISKAKSSDKITKKSMIMDETK